MVKSAIIDIYLPLANSLKSKRNIIKSIIHKVHNKYNVSIAEVDHNDKWKNSKLCLAMVSNEKIYSERKFSDIIKFIEISYPDIEITKIEDFQ
ncbi:MAG: DUF503 domain-containing protein [Candidatus Cloacimonetes bacterium]|nr:DUF503 domain-containing protein [Candidatus Cloacimonadota bacterium]MBL7086043.1 DUF503 domain-containing protein [Candidatus Cloacimonadota bacterium]